MKAPAFQFYADDFLAGTAEMTDSEVGLYVRLLCAQWSRGGLPNDTDELLRFSRGSTTLQAERVRRKFEVGDDGLLRNLRLESEREKQTEWRRKSSEGGKKSGVVRGSLKGGSKVVEPPYQPNGNSPLSTLHSPNNTPIVPKGTVAVGVPVEEEEEDPVPPELDDSTPESILAFFNEISGRQFQAIPANLKLIKNRLSEVHGDASGIRQMLTRQTAKWKTDPKMSEFLRPTTLFGKEKFSGYYDCRSLPIDPSVPAPVHPGRKYTKQEQDMINLGVDPSEVDSVLR